jgi:hypothetical protein
VGGGGGGPRRQILITLDGLRGATLKKLAGHADILR